MSAYYNTTEIKPDNSCAPFKVLILTWVQEAQQRDVSCVEHPNMMYNPSKKVLCSACNYMLLWLLLLTRCCLSQKILARSQYSVPTSQCGSEQRDRERDLVMLFSSGQREPEWTSDKVIILVFGLSCQTIMQRLRLIYCTPHDARAITFWEGDSGRLVFVWLGLNIERLSVKNDK